MLDASKRRHGGGSGDATHRVGVSYLVWFFISYVALSHRGYILLMADVSKRRHGGGGGDAVHRRLGGVRQHDRAHSPRREDWKELLRSGASGCPIIRRSVSVCRRAYQSTVPWIVVKHS